MALNASEKFHSVTLDKEKCKGCTTCIKQCPTEAIRVRNGKAKIIKERCIDCGQCIRHCPNRAKKAVCDGFELLDSFEYTVALPAPTLYGQFENLDDINYVLDGLLQIGFDDIYEVAKAAEILSDFTRKLMKTDGLPRPLISSACPTIVRLIKMRYPSLVQNVMPVVAPVELAAMEARKLAHEKTGIAPERIGVFFISPCPAKVTAARSPVGLETPVIDGVFSMSECYRKLVAIMKHSNTPRQLADCGLIGIGWAGSGGESAAILNEKHIAVDGIENVLQVLNDIEDDKLSDTEFIELNACTQGCVGGCLTVENPFVARAKLKKLAKYMPVSRNKFEGRPLDDPGMYWDNRLTYTPVWQLADDMNTAIEMMAKIEKLTKELPGLDCSSCGAPSCRALAEDIVKGFAVEEDCIFKMRERMQYLNGGGDADEYLPPPFRMYSGVKRKKDFE